jgi:ferritin-like protein
MEELEAIDWYAQRIDASSDPQLKKVLEHNRDEEKEHAAMVLEWLRRRDAVLDRHLRAYLFSQGPIEGLERIQEAKENDPSTSVEPSAGVEVGLGIGSLRERRG